MKSFTNNKKLGHTQTQISLSIKLFIALLFSIFIFAQNSSAADQAANVIEAQPAANDKIMLTIFLRHDQSKSLKEILEISEEQGFREKFPPKGTKIVSWHVAMGIGQIVTLELPASKLREVNLAIEHGAWKAFKTEFYPTYDLYPVIKDKLSNAERVTD